MALSDYEDRKIKTRGLEMRLRSFIDDCQGQDVPELIAIAQEIIKKAEKRIAYRPEELSREYNELGRLKTALRLAKKRNEMIRKGDKKSAEKMQESIVRWCGRNPDGSPQKIKVRKWDKGWRYALKMILLIVVLPSLFGFFLYFYLEYLLMLIFIIPGAIAFLGGALKNGAKV